MQNGWVNDGILSKQVKQPPNLSLHESARSGSHDKLIC
jgi:hypothetical protein